MSWTPVLTVTIAGTDYTGNTINLVQLRRGRNTVYTSVQPAIAAITLLDIDGTGIVPTVSDPITVTLEDTAGNAQTLFVGEISDWFTQVYDSGIKNSVGAAIRITAVSNIARLFRRQVLQTGRPVEKDGERILAILVDAFAVIWQEASGQWDDYSIETWETFDPTIDFGLVDSPGIYDVEELEPEPNGYNSGSISGDTGLSAGGLLYETASGRVGYADFFRRFTNAENGYLTVPSSKLTASLISTTSQVADLANVVNVRFANGEVTRADLESVDRFGRLTQNLTTVLNNAGDAGTFAERYLAGHSQPAVSFEQAPIRLDQDIDPQLRDALIGIQVNDAIEITNIPQTLGLTAFTGFVEGLRFEIDPFRCELQLFVSETSLSLGPTFWASVPTIAWEDVPAGLQWIDAGSL